MGMSGSASFQRVRKSSYDLRAASLSPIITCARPSCKCDKAPPHFHFHDSGMVDDLLKLSRRLTAVSSLQVSQTAKICGHERGRAKIVRKGSAESIDGFVWSVQL